MIRILLIAGSLLATSCLSTAEPAAPARRATARGAVWSSDFDGVDFLAGWQAQDRGKFGFDNLSIERDPKLPFGHFLRVRYPRGASSPRGSRAAGVKPGGAQFYGTLPQGPVDAQYLRYYVRFEPGFDFVKGGKLPGFYGGTEVSGGRIPDGTNGFSTRFMWRSEGQGEVYAYLPSSAEFGTSLGRGDFRFTPGQWHCVEQQVVLNDPGAANGVVRAWLDGKLVYENRSLVYRTVRSLRIEGVFFSTFFGGGDSSWAPSRDLTADFAHFATGTSRPGCDLELP
ncbi:MAG TPA: hypothetical protein VHV51_13175 [Polyangiaceae bacterium]|jgi:hypothetical protein|nr:hypothetical protein [Polyangiaceae bacterium]